MPVLFCSLVFVDILLKVVNSMILIYCIVPDAYNKEAPFFFFLQFKNQGRRWILV